MRQAHDDFLSSAFQELITSMGKREFVPMNEIKALNQSDVSSFIINFNRLKLQSTDDTNNSGSQVLYDFQSHFHVMNNKTHIK